MTKEKIKKLESVLSENSSLVNSRQEHIIFSKFILGKMKELQDILFKEYGINGRRGILSLAVMYLLEDLEDNKSKTKTDGKEI
jgi:hypothetical protein